MPNSWRKSARHFRFRLSHCKVKIKVIFLYSHFEKMYKITRKIK